jgi:phosphopantothenoylcysteine decarboxylase/phosphopantothenate--cysteine ligase
VLVSGPTALEAPAGAELVRVRSAEQMNAAVQQHAAHADIVVMAAAVADYRPSSRADGKIEKTEAPLSLSLVRTPDILAGLSRARGAAAKPLLIGFAAESGDPVARGTEKLHRKGADLIVANDISREGAGFESDMNAATLITAVAAEPFALGPKSALAAAILDRAEHFLQRAPERNEA